jgi:hypothetical protein
MDPSRYPIPVGVLLMALAIIFLIGWNFLNWTFVDPFFWSSRSYPKSTARN